MSSYSNSSDDPEAGEAWREVVRIRARIRARRWWYVAESSVIASSLTASYIAIHSWLDLLAKHTAALGEAGYGGGTKVRSGKRLRTWYSLTDRGQRAFDEYVATLREMGEQSTVTPRRS